MQQDDQSAHQQIQYGNSKLIFYFKDHHHFTTPSSSQNSNYKTIKSFAPRSQLSSYRQPTTTQTRGVVSKKKDTLSQNETKKGQLQKKSRLKIKICLKKENNQRTQKQKMKPSQKGANTQKAKKRPQVKSSLKIHKTNKFQKINNQRHLTPCIKNNEFFRLSEGDRNAHEKIKSMYGNHHLLYINSKDYLSLFANKQKYMSQQTAKRKAFICEQIFDDSDRIAYDKISKMVLKRNYVDQEFCYLDYNCIGGDQVEWVYIEPGSSNIIFPQLSLRNAQGNNEIQIVMMLKLLYVMQPEIFHRLVEPPQKNVFCVWLFHEGKLQPVVIDGYFPIKIIQEQQTLYFGKSREQLWIDIFIKCISKLNNSYDLTKLNQISLSQLYLLLTGLNIKKIDLEVIKDQSTLKKFYKRQRKRNSMLVFQNNQQILLTHGLENVLNSPEGDKGIGAQVFSIPPFKVFNIANFIVFEGNVTKIQIQCEMRSWIHFFISKLDHKVKIYFYRIRNKNLHDHQLCLVYQLNPWIERSLQIQQGRYRILYEDGTNLLQSLFVRKNEQIFHKNSQAGTYQIVMLGQSIKYLGKSQILIKKSNFIQDSQHFYSLN